MKTLPFDIIQHNCFVQIKFQGWPVYTSEYCEMMMILVSSAKLMLSSVLRSKVSLHSFSLDRDGLTITIEDYTKYSKQNAEKVAKHLQRVYSVLKSRYGCGCGLKY